MFKNIITILIIAGCILVIVVFVAPRYKNIMVLRTQSSELQNALSTATQLRAMREQLKKQVDSFSVVQLEQLETLLPAHVDNVKFSTIDIKRLADQNGLILKDVNTIEPETVVNNQDTGTEDPLGRINVEFSLAGPYAGFVNFLSQLERSLRIVDVESIAFSQQPARLGEVTQDRYNFDIIVSTYWLRATD